MLLSGAIKDGETVEASVRDGQMTIDGGKLVQAAYLPDAARRFRMPDGMAQDQPSAARQQADPQALEAENASLKDRLLRALADADNTRRLAERTAEEARRYAIADFARELLTVADNLKRAIAAADSQGREGRDASLVEGVRATERMLRAVFERFGIRKIDALGAPFDPA